MTGAHCRLLPLSFGETADPFEQGAHVGLYTPQQHQLWRRLYERQARLIPGRACDVFVDSLNALDVSDGIPRFDRTTEALFKATGWELVAVFDLAAGRQDAGAIDAQTLRTLHQSELDRVPVKTRQKCQAIQLQGFQAAFAVFL